jgi:hypothetical protein
MRKLKVVLLLASSLFAAAAASAIVYDEPVDSHSMMGRGMMGGGMTGRMGGMREHCSAMMSGRADHGRPNEQWRNHPSSAPDGDK